MVYKCIAVIILYYVIKAAQNVAFVTKKKIYTP